MNFVGAYHIRPSSHGHNYTSNAESVKRLIVIVIVIVIVRN